MRRVCSRFQVLDDRHLFVWSLDRVALREGLAEDDAVAAYAIFAPVAQETLNLQF